MLARRAAYVPYSNCGAGVALLGRSAADAAFERLERPRRARGSLILDLRCEKCENGAHGRARICAALPQTGVEDCCERRVSRGAFCAAPRLRFAAPRLALPLPARIKHA